MSQILIVHSHILDSNGAPGKEYEARLSEGLEQLISKKVDTLLLTGGPATPNISKTHAEAAHDWLIQNGAAKDNIISEKTGSLETVGEVIFARKEYDDIIMNPDNTIGILSSDYHINRIRQITSHILGDRKVDYVGISGFFRSPEAEKKSLEAFYTTFAGTKIGDLQSIEERLWKNHGLYKTHPLNPYKRI